MRQRAGESGGGNLAIATTMKAKVDGKIDNVAGTYASCPYIAGGLHYASPPPELPSLVDNGARPRPASFHRHRPTYSRALVLAYPRHTTTDGIFLAAEMMSVLAGPYTSADDATNPLAWPLYAGPADLAGLPPAVISVNECDPLRDEGGVCAHSVCGCVRGRCVYTIAQSRRPRCHSKVRAILKPVSQNRERWESSREQSMVTLRLLAGARSALRSEARRRWRRGSYRQCDGHFTVSLPEHVQQRNLVSCQQAGEREHSVLKRLRMAVAVAAAGPISSCQGRLWTTRSATLRHSHGRCRLDGRWTTAVPLVCEQS
eukprot:SAG11_NODE_744_length_7406_cov_2.773231_4_plen_315_part_00